MIKAVGRIYFRGVFAPLTFPSPPLPFLCFCLFARFPQCSYGSWGHCKLQQWGPGQSPGRKHIFAAYEESKKRI